MKLYHRLLGSFVVPASHLVFSTLHELKALWYGDYLHKSLKQHICSNT